MNPAVREAFSVTRRDATASLVRDFLRSGSVRRSECVMNLGPLRRAKSNLGDDRRYGDDADRQDGSTDEVVDETALARFESANEEPESETRGESREFLKAGTDVTARCVSGTLSTRFNYECKQGDEEHVKYAV